MQFKVQKMKVLKNSYKFIALAIFILFSLNEIKAQCEIRPEEGLAMPVCYKDNIRLSADLNTNYTYEWKHNNQVVEHYYDYQHNEVYVIVEITENNALYSLHVTNTETGAVICSPDPTITITMRPAFDITFQQIALTCSDRSADNGKTGKMKATASGGGYTNFVYEWDTPYSQYYADPQLATNLCAYTDYNITVTNEYGCSQTATARLKAYPNPNILLYSDPADTVYLDNPYVTWSFTNNDTVYDGHDTLIEISNFYWEFENHEETYTEATPRIIYEETENEHPVTKLIATSDQGCDSTYTKAIQVLPVKLKIPNIFTPNGDGHNDYFQIGYDTGEPINDLSKYFLSAKLTVFNRWGRTVYESSDYKNDWDGGKLPDGTYFYVLDCKGYTNNYRYQGSVMIWNSGR